MSHSAQPSAWPLQVLRSSQLDAQRLDTELITMVHEQFMSIFSLFQPGAISNYEPELTASLLCLVFGLTVWRGYATPGSTLLNLRYRNEWNIRTPKDVGRTGVDGPRLSLAQRLLFGVGFVALPYLWSRLHRLAALQDWMGDPHSSLRNRAWGWMRTAETAYRGASLLNLAVFLAQGRYRSLLERLLGARLVYERANMTRVISFEYLNRQLVWQELSELLLFMLPLLSATRLRAFLFKFLPNPAVLTGRSTPSVEIAAGGKPGDGSALADAACPICGTAEVLLPFQALPCSHTFCYYCLRSNTEADPDFKCPLDGQRVRAMRRRRRQQPALAQAAAVEGT